MTPLARCRILAGNAHRPCAIGAALSACIQQVRLSLPAKSRASSATATVSRSSSMLGSMPDRSMVSCTSKRNPTFTVDRSCSEHDRHGVVLRCCRRSPTDRFQRGVIPSTFFFHQQGDLVGGGLKGSPWEG